MAKKSNSLWIIILIILAIIIGIWAIMHYSSKPSTVTTPTSTEKIYADVEGPLTISSESCEVACVKTCTDAGYAGYSKNFVYVPNKKCTCNCYK